MPAVLVLVGLAAGVAGAILVAGAAGSTPPRVIGGDLPVDAAATDPHDITANNSPSLARNPTRPANLALVNRVDSPSFSCALHVSTDSGGHWSRLAIPFPDGEEQPPRCFAPDVAYGADGTLFVSFVTLRGTGNTPNALWLASSADGGRTLETPRRVWGPDTFGPRLVADPDRAGRVWLTWLQVASTATLGFASTGNPVLVARSDDSGATWAGPYQASSPSRARSLAPVPARGPDGRLYVAYLDLGDDVLDYSGAHAGRGGDPYPGHWSLVLARSDDAGATWSEVTVDATVVPAARIVALFPPTPALAVDRSRNRVYLALADGRAGSPDVWLWSSTGGSAFGPPVRVNDTPSADHSTQSLPALGVSAGGRLDVVYDDRRADPHDVLTEVSLQSSSDGGRTFSPSVRLTDRPFDSGIGFGSERGLADLGSRQAVLASRTRTLAVWTDTRAGTVASGKQVLTRAVVASGSMGRSGRRLLGVVLLVLAGAVLATTTVIGRRATVARRERAPRGPLSSG